MSKRTFTKAIVLPPVLRRAVYAKTGGRCFYCGLPLEPEPGVAKLRDWLPPLARRRMSCDHQIPQQRGGNHQIDNLVPACSACNSKKALSTAEEYRFRCGLTEGKLPFRFAFDCAPARERDYIVVASPPFARALIQHNFPRAYEGYAGR